MDVSALDPSKTLEGKITILGFLGSELQNQKTIALNLNQKIYKPFFEFNDFQFMMLVPKGTEEKVAALKYELSQLEDISRWNFVHADEVAIQQLFSSLNSNVELDAQMGTPYVFIIDKDRSLRGRTDDEDEGTKFGFKATSVAELNNKMEDDVKIILAEYRLALKKNNASRSK